MLVSSANLWRGMARSKGWRTDRHRLCSRNRSAALSFVAREVTVPRLSAPPIGSLEHEVPQSTWKCLGRMDDLSAMGPSPCRRMA
jgi:hypothetical protein